MTDARNEVRRVVADAVAELGLPVTMTGDDIFTVELPGANKLRTDCTLELGQHCIEVRAFVARRPDENQLQVYRWLLERNLKLYAVAFCVDHLGDIYLTGRLSLDAVTAAEVDRLLGSVAEVADSSFNSILELGFASSIKKEWQWRLDRGESTANLEAFKHLAPERPSGDEV